MNNAIRGAATVLAMSPELIRQAEFTLARRMGRIPPRRPAHRRDTGTLVTQAGCGPPLSLDATFP